MTNNKKVSLGKVAGVSLLSLVMMFAAAAPSMYQANAGGTDFDGVIGKMLFSEDKECSDGIKIVKRISTSCQFVIMYVGDLAIVEDTVPAEFEVTNIEYANGNSNIENGIPCTWESTGKEIKNDRKKGATKITCGESKMLSVIVHVETRESPATANNENKVAKFKPTSCGPLVLNDGAVAYASLNDVKILEKDSTGDLVPIVIDRSVPIILTAVNPDGFDCEGSPIPGED